MDPFDFDFEHDEFIHNIVEKYEKSIRDNDSFFLDSESFEKLAEFYEFKGDYTSANQVLDIALEQYPFSSILLIRKAEMLFEDRENEKALDFLDKAEMIDSSDMEIHLLKAEILVSESRHEEAIQLLLEKLEEAEEVYVLDIYMGLAEAYEDLEEHTLVFEYLEKALWLYPNSLDATSRYSYCMEITQEYEKAISFLTKLLDKHPYSEPTWYNLSLAYKGIQNYEKAIDALEYLLAIDEHSDVAMEDLIELQVEAGQYQQALENIKEYENSFMNERILLLKGQCLAYLGDHKLSRYHYKKALHIQPNIPEAYFRIGESYKFEENWDLAFSFYEKAAELSKNNYDFYMAAVEAAMLKGNLPDAFRLALTALDIAPARFEAYIYAAKLILNDGLPDVALDMLEKGMICCKSIEELTLAKIGILLASGQKKEAINQLILANPIDIEKAVFMYLMHPEAESDMEISWIMQSKEND